MSAVSTETGYINSDDGSGSSGTLGFAKQYYESWRSNSYSVNEIEEENNESEVFEIKNGEVDMASIIREEIMEVSSLSSFDYQNGDDNVYVAVGKSDSSMDALLWTLKHAVNPVTLVCLIHVFPELRYIPTPLGKLPRNQVSPAQVESFMAQERGKRKELLQKYLRTCSAAKVKVDTMLIESDMVAKAILELIPVLNIRKLVVGTTKSNLRKLKLRRGSGTVDQILQDAATDSCDIKIICEGKEVLLDQISSSPSPRGNDDDYKPKQEAQQRHNSFSCSCFRV